MQSMGKERIWITWETQRRNRTLSKILNADLFELDYSVEPLVWRYVKSIINTIRIFINYKPRIIFVQNPSLILAVLAVFWGRLFSKPVIVDAHNAGIRPFAERKNWANVLASYVLKRAEFTIVTNKTLANYAESKGGRCFVLPDPIPELHASNCHGRSEKLSGSINIVLLASWAEDEPIEEVFRAAAMLPTEFHIYITGKSKGKETTFSIEQPANVTLTGFLSEDQLVCLLQQSDLIMDLTTRDDCLLCGAYEAVSLGKPLLVSDTPVLREYFYRGTLYTNNTANDLAEKIATFPTIKHELLGAVEQLRVELEESWHERHAALEARCLRDL